MLNNKVPHPPVRMNIFGRMRYSGDTNAVDYNDFCFDDVWRAIGTLWAVVGLLVVNAVREKYKSR